MAKFNVQQENCNRLILWAVIMACILLLKLYLFIIQHFRGKQLTKYSFEVFVNIRVVAAH